MKDLSLIDKFKIFILNEPITIEETCADRYNRFMQEFRHTSAERLLTIEHNGDVDMIEAILSSAISSGSPEQIETFLKGLSGNPNLGAIINDALPRAVKKEDPDKVRLLVGFGAKNLSTTRDESTEEVWPEPENYPSAKNLAHKLPDSPAKEEILSILKDIETLDIMNFIPERECRKKHNITVTRQNFGKHRK